MNIKITSLYIVSIFKNIVNDNVFSSFVNFLKMFDFETDFDKLLKAYSEFINKLYEANSSQNFYEYIKNLIYTDENIISKGCTDCIRENEQLLSTAEYELALIYEILNINYDEVKNKFLNLFSQMSEIIEHLPKYNTHGIKVFSLQELIDSYSKNGYGKFACYCAFKYTENGEIKQISYFDSLTFKDLKNYEYQKEVLINNTKAFLENKPANNVLLYGDRGCGKSSSVKALINEFSEYNLKMIQVNKDAFVNLPDLFEKLRSINLKFIIFADDLSFNEDDKNFSSIKAILEGSLVQKPDNVIIYATTNRMHLVKESFSAREGSEIHYNDTIDELVSLSDRFGIMLTFSSLNKDEFLNIVGQIAQDCCLNVDEDLNKSAMMFAMQKGIMTPRVARQFVTDFIVNQ